MQIGILLTYCVHRLCPILVAWKQTFKKIMLDHMLHMVLWTSSIYKVVICCPDLHGFLIFPHWKHFDIGWWETCPANSLQLIRWMKCGTDLKQHRMIYPFLSSQPSSTPSLTWYGSFSLPGWQLFLLISHSCEPSNWLQVWSILSYWHTVHVQEIYFKVITSFYGAATLMARNIIRNITLTSSACIRYRHRSSVPGMMVWVSNGYKTRTSLFWTNCNLNADRYSGCALSCRPVKPHLPTK